VWIPEVILLFSASVLSQNQRNATQVLDNSIDAAFHIGSSWNRHQYAWWEDVFDREVQKSV